ncbi:MAG: amylo-alpha-1,6-glucosidase [bacterium]|nr:amylo-alpha-1,6-glucosidase [bacterium]
MVIEAREGIEIQEDSSNLRARDKLNADLLRKEVSRLELFINPDGYFNASTANGQFPAKFGRDIAIGIESAVNAAAVSPTVYEELEREHLFPVFRRNLVFLGQHQGQGPYNPETAEEEGGILHEQREGPENQVVLAGLKRGLWPVKGEEGNLRMRYFGSVDSTPLWLIAVHRYCEVTGDYSLADELAPQIEKACQYLLRHENPEYIPGNSGMKKNPEAGLVLFKGKASKGGLVHQNWMDSAESNPPPPIYYTEIQGYYYKAHLHLAELLRRRNPDSELASQLKSRANTLKENFNKLFYWPDQGYYYSAIQKLDDGRLKPVREVRSNIGHCLWSGIIDKEKVPDVVKRLMERDMFGPTGIRTLSEDSPNYDRCKYHMGRVWAHDNDLIVRGIHRYGYHKEADQIACRVLNHLDFLTSPYECWGDLDDKPALPEDLAHDKPPPNTEQFWAETANISFRVHTPSYTPPESGPEKVFLSVA